MSKAPCARGGGGSRVAPCPPCKRNDTLLPLTLRGVRPSECRPCDVRGPGASRCSSTNVAIELDRAVRKSIGPAGGAAGPQRRAPGTACRPRQSTETVDRQKASCARGGGGGWTHSACFHFLELREKEEATVHAVAIRPSPLPAVCRARLPARCPSVRDAWRRRCAPCTRRSSRTTADRRSKGADCHPCQPSGHQAVTGACAQ